MRLAQHIRDLRKGTHVNRMLRFMYQKYGEPYMEVIEECSDERQFIAEQEAIDILQPELNANLIASKPPNHTGKKRSEETRRKLSLALKGNKGGYNGKGVVGNRRPPSRKGCIPWNKGLRKVEGAENIKNNYL
jgi:hypothetical protein